MRWAKSRKSQARSRGHGDQVGLRVAVAPARGGGDEAGAEAGAGVFRDHGASTSSEADGLAGADLGRPVDIGVDDDGYHRVAAGDGVVGEEHDRLAARRHLDRAADHALAGQLALVGAAQGLAFEAHADAVAAAGDGPGGAGERGGVGDPVGAGAEDGAERDGPAAWAGRRGRGPAARGLGLGADGEHVAGLRAGPGRGRRGCRPATEPRTSSTARPPRTAR